MKSEWVYPAGAISLGGECSTPPVWLRNANWPLPHERLTALRLMVLFILEHWKQRIECWSKGMQAQDTRLISTHKIRKRRRSVYCYFDNDAKVRAPFDARALLNKLGLDDTLQTTPGEPWQ